MNEDFDLVLTNVSRASLKRDINSFWDWISKKAWCFYYLFRVKAEANSRVVQWKKIDSQVDMLKGLVKLRGKASYGYVDGLNKDDFKDDASNFKDPVKNVIEDCNNLVNEFSTKKFQKNDDNGSDN